MVDTLYTIGYSGFPIKNFIDTLKANKIALVIDVRSQPYSQHFPDYNKEALEKELKRNGIYYRNYNIEFGARQEERCFYTDTGYLDFEKYAKSDNFQLGFQKLKQSMAKGFIFTLMCAEKDPMNCHRTIMVARVFHDAGFKIIHLLPNGTVTQEDIEERMLERYFPNRHQLTLFNDDLNESNYIAHAYKKRNAEIGYSIEEETK